MAVIRKITTHRQEQNQIYKIGLPLVINEIIFSIAGLPLVVVLKLTLIALSYVARVCIFENHTGNFKYKNYLAFVKYINNHVCLIKKRIQLFDYITN